jgi:UDP-N-acetylglucosamine:LPS N-acetylglucosamine transferase
MVKKQHKKIILVAGEGGHFEQAKRLYFNMREEMLGNVIVLTDTHNKKITPEILHCELGDFRGKDGFNLYGFFRHLKNIYSIVMPIIKSNDVALISTGPGIAILPALLVKVFGGKVVHIETWSRFYSKSGAGKIMYLIADKFYFQNKELSLVYPKGIYAGRL